jgi:hypothetical protein
MKEIWKDIPGYEGLYQVSSLGRVKSLGRNVMKWNHYSFQPEKILRACTDNYGYLIVGLYKEKKLKSFKVHRLVAQAFIENPKNKDTVNHINGNKQDNSIENLEWATNAENKKHAFATGLTGGEHFRNNKRSVKVIQYDKGINLIEVYPSAREAERQTGICNTSIIQCCKSKIKTAGGYIWKYAEKATE